MADAHPTVNSIVLSAGSGQDLRMTRLSIVFIALLFAAACSPVTAYHREGVTRAEFQDDLLTCRVEALQDAPVANQLRRGPPQYIPGYRSCTSSGSCYRTGGFFYPGEVYSVDVNASLRRDLRTRCMAKQGYSAVELPRCTYEAPPLIPTDTLPVLSATSCVVKDANGQFQIIDTAG